MFNPRDYTVYLDQDGVLADFVPVLMKTYGVLRLPDDVFKKEVATNPKFWESLPLMCGSKQLYSYLKRQGYNIELLSAAGGYPKMIEGKNNWMNRYFPTIHMNKRNYCRRIEKQNYANEKSILFDDLLVNVKEFETRGGKGFLVKSPTNAIKDFKIWEQDQFYQDYKEKKDKNYGMLRKKQADNRKKELKEYKEKQKKEILQLLKNV